MLEILIWIKSNLIYSVLSGISAICTIILLPKKIKELYQYYLVGVKFKEAGNFGKNILHENVKELSIGNYSMCATVVRNKNLLVRIIGDKTLKWGFNPMSSSWQYGEFNENNNSREFFTTNNQNYDLKINLEGYGVLTVEILEKEACTLIRKNNICIINRLE